MKTIKKIWEKLNKKDKTFIILSILVGVLLTILGVTQIIIGARL